MTDDEKNKQVDQDKPQEIFERSINREHRHDQASYQPEKNELDDKNPPDKDSE